MTTIDPAFNELVKAFELVNKPVTTVHEHRLYYDSEGRVIGIWNTDYPADGNFIILPNTDMFQKYSTHRLRVVNNELKLIDFRLAECVKLQKSKSGQAVVRGHAALAVAPGEYQDIEFYDKANN